MVTSTLEEGIIAVLTNMTLNEDSKHCPSDFIGTRLILAIVMDE